MRKYYDEIYPGFLNKYGKKFDAKVGETTLKLTEGVPRKGISGESEPVRYIDITPKMKEALSKGQPMFKEGGLVSNTDTIKARLIEQGMPEDKAFMQALKLANEKQMADGGLVGAYQKYIGQPFANVAGPFARGLLGLEKPEYGEEQAYRTGQALSNMPGAGAPAGILKAATQAPEALKAAQMLPEMLGGLLGATVFHGSPYKFRKFDPTKIGSGEGAQSFGHGHYVAGEEDVAKFYRDKLSDKPEVKIGGETIGTQAQSPESVVAARLASTYSSMAIRGTPKTEDVVGVIEEGLDRTLNHVAKTGNFKLYQDLMDQKAALGRMKDQGIEFQSTGSLYKIDLPDEQINKMLDWDKPLSQQSKNVQAALQSILEQEYSPKMVQALSANKTGKEIVEDLNKLLGGPSVASQYLKAEGVPGIRYLDQGSRAAGKGTSNYVVFPGNEDLLKILERNNQPMAKGGLAGLKNLPAAAKAAKTVKPVEILSPEQSQANLQRLLEESAIKQRLFHGTTASEGGKGEEAIKTLKPSKEGALGSGAYLTPAPDYAGGYAEGAGGNVLPVYVQMKNPLILEGKGDPMVEALIKLGMDQEKASRVVERAYENKGYIGKEVESRARAAGYDGLMQYRDGNLSEVVSYNPNAIKSAIGNRGTYDITSPELSKAKGGLAGLKNLPAAARAAKSKYAEEAAAAARASPRSKQEIESIAQRIAEQTQPGFVRPDPAFSVNPEGKSRAVYEMEQRTPMIV